MAPYDLFVIGAGSAGVRAARMAAQRGARVAIADPGALGGTCVNLGCIPKKLYRYAAGYGSAFAEAAGYGWTLPEPPRFDWQTLKARRAAEISRLNGVYQGLLEGAGAELLRERAVLDGPGAVRVGGVRLAAKNVLVATGSAPQRPAWSDAGHVVVSDDLFDLPRLPERLVVLGGGYIGCEFASIFAGLGVGVSLVLRAPQVLRGFDDDLRAFVGDALRAQGIQIVAGARIARVEAAGDARRVVLEDGRSVEGDLLLAATGRTPRSAGLGLEEAGVELGANGAVVVDERYATRVPGIHAAGDLVGRLPLTPVALAEAMVVVDSLFGGAPRTLDYTQIPTAVFTHPELATVGLTEAAARARGAEVQVFRSTFRPLRHTLSGSADRTLMKLVVDARTDRVLGVHMAGDDAAEVLQGFAAALVAGVTKAQLDSTIGIHPTAAEEFVTMRAPVA